MRTIRTVLTQMKQPGETLFEIEAAAKSYSKNIKGTPLDRTLSKVQKYFGDNALIAVPFDSGISFCVMKNSTYAEKLEKVLDCEQFRKLRTVVINS